VKPLKEDVFLPNRTEESVFLPYLADWVLIAANTRTARDLTGSRIDAFPMYV
jgi:hypothetical protein